MKAKRSLSGTLRRSGGSRSSALSPVPPLSLLLSTVLLISACGFLPFLNGLVGSGVVTSETRTAAAFSGVVNATSGSVTVVPGRNYSVTVTSDENLLAAVTTNVSGGVLTVAIVPGTSVVHYTRLDVLIEVPVLTSIEASGSGSVSIQGTAYGNLLQVMVSGSGSITGNARVDGLRSVVSGSGSITLSGQVGSQTAVVTGSGNVDNRNLISESATATVSGSGNVWLQVTSSLTGTITGSGNIFYRGGALISVSRSGSGSAYPFL